MTENKTPNAAPFAEGCAYIDGTFRPIGEARISVLDWGFIHGDAVYDVVHVWDGAFFRLGDHVARFLESCRRWRLDPGADAEAIAAALQGCAARFGEEASYVAMVCTRGRARRRGSRDPRECENRFFAYALPFIWVIAPEVMERGARVKVASQVRRIPADSVDPEAKNYHWGDFTQGLFEAKEGGYDTTLLLDHADRVTEGPGFNVFLVKDGRVITPDAGALLGITRRTVLELAEELGLEPVARPVPLWELMEADEVFLSTTGGGVTPVASVDARIFSNAAPGPVTLRLQEAYWALHEAGRFATPVRYELAGAEPEAAS